MNLPQAAHFFVTLRDSFPERCAESAEFCLFDELDNPYRDAESRLTQGRIYPVMAVGGDGHRLTVIDDAGRPWAALIGLFKLAGETFGEFQD